MQTFYVIKNARTQGGVKLLRFTYLISEKDNILNGEKLWTQITHLK